jgi:hypothetical protein
MKRSKALDPYLFREGSVPELVPSLTLGVIGRILKLLDTFLYEWQEHHFVEVPGEVLVPKICLDSRG